MRRPTCEEEEEEEEEIYLTQNIHCVRNKRCHGFFCM